MNDKINELYNKLDAQDEIIEQLELKVASLEKDKKKAIEYIKQDNINVEEEKWVKSEILKKYRYSVKSKLLEILGDKENE